jgi:hypothetical protein
MTKISQTRGFKASISRRGLDRRSIDGVAGDKPRLEAVEHFQISFRPGGHAAASSANPWAGIALAELVFE